MSKSILITGVKGGIGSSIAKYFKAKDYYVYGLDINEDGDNYCDEFIPFDLNRLAIDSDYFSAQKANLAQIENLDVLVNNAAVQKLSSLADISLADWQETLNVNLTGPLLLSQVFLNALEASQGSIINIASIHHQLTKQRFISYATSKSALVGLTKAMAVDLKGKVRVNSISPAAIKTDMLLDGFEGDQSAIKQLYELHPIQRIGYPEEVARLVYFLTTENNGFIHGANISLDGGISSVLKDLD